MPSDPIDLGHYLIDGAYFGDGGEPKGLFFDDSTANTFRQVAEGAARFVIPEGEFKGHCVIVGQSGSGKTETLLRLIYEVGKQWAWQVIVIDAKNDRYLESEIALIAAQIGLKYGAFPEHPYDIFHGSPQAVATRLLDLIDIDPRSRAGAHAFLAKAVVGGVTKGESWGQLKHNLAHTDAGLIGNELELEIKGQLAALFDGSLKELLDEKKEANGKPVLPINAANLDISYLGVDALSIPFVATRVAACLLREVSDLVVNRRKDPKRKVLLVFDEFSAVPVGIATDLVERIRSFGVQVVLGVQSFAGLGAEAQRLVEASNWLILHRSGNPDPFLEVVGGYSDDAGVKPLIDGLEVRRLADGQVYVAERGQIAKVMISKWQKATPPAAAAAPKPASGKVAPAPSSPAG